MVWNLKYFSFWEWMGSTSCINQTIISQLLVVSQAFYPTQFIFCSENLIEYKYLTLFENKIQLKPIPKINSRQEN